LVLLTEFWLLADCLSLTTISQHGIEIGEVAAKLLIDRLESKEDVPYETVVIKTKLKERESTRKL
jgi:LacI family transcriptional regulator